MIRITPTAAGQIRKAAGQTGADNLFPRIAARLDDKGVIEYGMGFNAKAEGDTQVVSEGITVLVSPGGVEFLTGATLDFVEINPGERQFIFVNPNDPSAQAAPAFALNVALLAVLVRLDIRNAAGAGRRRAAPLP